MDNANCKYGCNAQGQVLKKGEWLPCPVHGKKETGFLVTGQLPNGKSLYDLLQIPEEYKDNWVQDIGSLFRGDALQNCIPESINQLRNLLEMLYETTAIDHNIYMNSVYIYGNPNLIDLKPFAFTIQRIAFENNISVVPAISINTLAGLITLQDYSTVGVYKESDISYINNLNRQAGEGAEWYYRTKLTYSDYLRASLCIVFDNAITTDGGLKGLQGFLEERGRRNLPTLVFSTTFWDSKRENLLKNTQGGTRLSRLTPYLLLGKKQIAQAKESGWLYTNVIDTLPTQDKNLSTLAGYTYENNGINTGNYKL